MRQHVSREAIWIVPAAIASIKMFGICHRMSLSPEPGSSISATGKSKLR